MIEYFCFDLWNRSEEGRNKLIPLKKGIAGEEWLKELEKRLNSLNDFFG